MSGTLFVVATPIGNLSDITFRAVETLKRSAYVLAESPHHSKRLFEAYSIDTPMIKYNDDYKVDAIIEKAIDDVMGGLDISLISDAGTPTISDPGYRIVKRFRDEGLRVESIPGASALIAALSASGLPTDRFVFLGFLPKTSGRRVNVLKSADIDATIIFYESPNRIIKSLLSVKEALGNRDVVVARELTKVYEEFITGSVDEVIEKLKSRPSIKGEFVVLVKKHV
ncbi:16S rRNA (cytidine(1402)-2'-O)-methyltransferase [Hippea maritima]|uniref:Ribosomal RNA small subunit methyltransferase I n=1 Tax=Hippea maritima (strain ATCC 700847 / DSM 10411 / MH2) TaxID=760142 RepID=F2LVJ8_HIPMA|nr:16S rRNA (cytidine(1402)-2'-O)-methyltransferase [Hippea maritima]AEA33782.1 Ribosomal RNA small subunit methyltransferase I [Hippea maritima DSM 10411]